MTGYLADALRHGLSGWPISDAVVTLIESDYTSPGTTAADLRKLTPLVVRAAVGRGRDCRLRADPALPPGRGQRQPDVRSWPCWPGTGRSRSRPTVDGAWFTVEGDIPAAEVHRLQRQLHAATHGEGVLEVRFDRYEPALATPARP